MIVKVHEAKTHLSRLSDRAAAGEEIILGKSGEPLARLVPYRAVRQRRRPGGLAGQLHIADDFDATAPEVFDDFGGDRSNPRRSPSPTTW